MPLALRILVSVLVAGALGACAKKQEHAQEHRDADKAHAHHAHVAPHGGVLVEVGAHQFNIELVHDVAEGRLTAYILDAHAENFVRVPIQGFALVALVNGRRESLPMAAVANPVTGETIGDTSEFSAQADWLKNKIACDAYIPAIDIRGTTFSEIRFAFRTPAAK